MPAEYESNDTQNSKPYPAQNADVIGDEDALWHLLSVYADGEATSEEAAQVESLLRADPACARGYAFLQLTSDSVRSLPEVEPPAGLRESIFAATTARPTFRRRVAVAWSDLRRVFTIPAVGYALPTGALAAAALVAFGFWHYRNREAGLGMPDRPPIAGLGPEHLPAVAPPALPEIRSEKDARIARVERRPVLETQPLRVAPMAHPGVSDSPKAHYAAVREPLSAPSKSIAAPPKPLHPRALPRTPDQDVQTAFSLKPMMDDINKRPALVLDRSAGLDTPDVHPAEGEAQPTGQAASGAAMAQANAISTDAVETRANRRFVHRLIIPQPPNPKVLLTSADMRRERSAEMLGYDRETVQNITRREAGVSLSIGRF